MIVGQQSYREILLLLPILSAAVLIRCIRISQPFVDPWSWRQADVAMIAENFYRNGFNILYPQINWAGHHPGYVGTEFPLVPFMASVLYLLFGIHEWIGRSVSLLFYGLSMPLFYRLVKVTYNERSAICATLLYGLIPLSIVSSRSFMPDMASLSLSILAVYLFVLWIKRPTTHSKLFVLAVTATSLAISVKLPALIIGIPFFYIAWQEHGPNTFSRKELWLFAFWSLIWPTAWYCHAYVTSVLYPPHHIFGRGGIEFVSLSRYG